MTARAFRNSVARLTDVGVAGIHRILTQTDLLRRAHGARAGWAVGFDDREVEVLGREEVDGTARQRGAALVQLASVDGRAHTARDPVGTYVAVGDFPFGAGLLLAQSDATAQQAAAVTEELRRIVAGMRLAQLHEPDEHPAQLVSKQLEIGRAHV